MTIASVLALFVCVLRLVIALQLTQLARRPEARNLLWLAVVFYANGLFDFFGPSGFLNIPLFAIGAGIAQFALVGFIHQTFYRGIYSPYRYLLAITLVASAGALGLGWLGRGDLADGVIGHLVCLNWLWHLVAAYRAYQHIAPDPNVETWIKARYRLMVTYCLFMAVSGLALILQPTLATAPWLALSLLLAVIVGVVLQYLAWGMPEWFRQYLNRGYQPLAQTALTPEESLRQANELLSAQNAELEARVAERTAKLEATLNALPDLMFELDQAGRIHDFRAPRSELLFAPPETFLGRPLREVVPASAAEVVETALAEAVLTGHHFGATYSLPLLQGLSWFELSIAAKGGPELAERHWVVLVRDITQRHQAEAALQAKTAELLALNETLQAAEEEQRAVNEELAAINDDLAASERALRAKNEELARFNQAMLNREMRNIELKEEINRLSAELGRPAPYPPIWREGGEKKPG